MPEGSAEVTSRTDWLEDLVLRNYWSRVLIGSAVAMLAAQMMVHHGGIASVNGVLTLLAGAVVWSAGLTLTVRPVVEEFGKLREVLHQ